MGKDLESGGVFELRRDWRGVEDEENERNDRGMGRSALVVYMQMVHDYILIVSYHISGDNGT